MDTITDLTAFIARNGTELVTDSRAVALAFGKRHKNVLRTIENMRVSLHPEIVEHYRLNCMRREESITQPICVAYFYRSL